jgi:histidinol dehydrogenase
MRIIDASDRSAVDRLLTPRRSADRTIERRVAAIVEAVRRRGDRALIGFARRLDQLEGPIEVSIDDMRRGAEQVSPEVRRAIKQAAANIAAVAARQLPRRFEVAVLPGVSVEGRVEPLESVGCYVPGGRFPLPSSLLMTAIPARVAGVRTVIATCPRPEPAVMAAAVEAGVSRLFRIGGAHAIAAMAYGTRTIPRVDKIVGPGNRWVAAAKARVSPDCAIDSTRDRPRSSLSPGREMPRGLPRTWSRKPNTIPRHDRFSSPGAARWRVAWRIGWPAARRDAASSRHRCERTARW